MKLSGRPVYLLVTEDGREVLSQLVVEVQHDTERHAFLVEVRESEDLGLWIKVNRDGSPHFVLIRWDYILAVDVPADFGGESFGMRV